jgi:hypothetical protein
MSNTPRACPNMDSIAELLEGESPGPTWRWSVSPASLRIFTGGQATARGASGGYASLERAPDERAGACDRRDPQSALASRRGAGGPGKEGGLTTHIPRVLWAAA